MRISSIVVAAFLSIAGPDNALATQGLRGSNNEKTVDRVVSMKGVMEKMKEELHSLEGEIESIENLEEVEGASYGIQDEKQKATSEIQEATLSLIDELKEVKSEVSGAYAYWDTEKNNELKELAGKYTEELKTQKMKAFVNNDLGQSNLDILMPVILEAEDMIQDLKKSVAEDAVIEEVEQEIESESEVFGDIEYNQSDHVNLESTFGEDKIPTYEGIKERTMHLIDMMKDFKSSTYAGYVSNGWDSEKYKNVQEKIDEYSEYLKEQESNTIMRSNLSQEEVDSLIPSFLEAEDMIKEFKKLSVSDYSMMKGDIEMQKNVDINLDEESVLASKMKVSTMDVITQMENLKHEASGSYAGGWDAEKKKRFQELVEQYTEFINEEKKGIADSNLSAANIDSLEPVLSEAEILLGELKNIGSDKVSYLVSKMNGSITNFITEMNDLKNEVSETYTEVWEPDKKNRFQELVEGYMMSIKEKEKEVVALDLSAEEIESLKPAFWMAESLVEELQTYGNQIKVEQSEDTGLKDEVNAATVESNSLETIINEPEEKLALISKMKESTTTLVTNMKDLKHEVSETYADDWDAEKSNRFQELVKGYLEFIMEEEKEIVDLKLNAAEIESLKPIFMEAENLVVELQDIVKSTKTEPSENDVSLEDEVSAATEELNGLESMINELDASIKDKPFDSEKKQELLKVESAAAYLKEQLAQVTSKLADKKSGPEPNVVTLTEKYVEDLESVVEKDKTLRNSAVIEDLELVHADLEKLALLQQP